MQYTSTASDYLNSSPADRRSLQHTLVQSWFNELETALNFNDMSHRAQRLVLRMNELGYPLNLLDEDGESMIAFGAMLSEGHSLTVQNYWDEIEGPSVLCSFSDATERLTLAATRGTKVVEVEPRD